MVQSAPGGSADVAARLYSDDLAKVLKVPITAVNRAGGAGIQGVTYVTRAKKDGYTLLQGSGTSIIILPLISKEATYDPLKDLVPLGHFVSVPMVIGVRSDSPFKTLAELIEYARKNPEKLKHSTGGIGTFSYINLDLLCVENKVKITTIPFKSGGEALPALLGTSLARLAPPDELIPLRLGASRLCRGISRRKTERQWVSPGALLPGITECTPLAFYRQDRSSEAAAFSRKRARS